MFVTRGNAYDDFVTMRNFSGSPTEKFLMLVDGREVLQPMGGTITWGTEEVPLAILDRAEIIRGPGASIWGTNAVSGVINVTTKKAESTQGNSVRLAIESTGTFLGEFVNGGKIRDGEYYRVWVRDQEYAESELLSGLLAQDDGYGRKVGIRYDKNLRMDLDLTVAGAYSTRQFEHIFDLSYRLFYINNDPLNPFGLTPGAPLIIPIGNFPAAVQSLLLANTNWPMSEVSPFDSLGGITRYQNFEELAQDAGHLRTRLSGITSHDFEWSVDAFAEKYETNLGHIGHQWERDEYNLEFRGNRPLGDHNHLAFGLGYRYMEFDVTEVVTSPWDFPVFKFDAGPPTSISALSISGYNSYPILYYRGLAKFERFSAFVQDTFEINEDCFVSFGSKFEDGDFSGTSWQSGIRASFSVNPDNLLWGAYSRAHRQASLVEKYTEVSYARFWDASMAYG